MALELKFLVQIDVSGDFLWVTDTTGAYSVDNDTGWGAPNPEQNQSAVVSHVVRRAQDNENNSEDVALVPVNADVIYDPSAANDKQNQIQYTFLRFLLLLDTFNGCFLAMKCLFKICLLWECSL